MATDKHSRRLQRWNRAFFFTAGLILIGLVANQKNYVACAETSTQANGSGSATVLTDASFNQVVGQAQHVFVKFYAPWCGHCKNLAPTWEQLANAFKDESSVVIAKLDGTQEHGSANKYHVRGYPTLLFFPAGSTEPQAYQGPRALEQLTEFVNERAGTARNPDGTANTQYGLVSDFTVVLESSVCKGNDASTCYSTMLDAVKDVKETRQTPYASSILEKAKQFYITALAKAAKDWRYVSKELSRLGKLIKDSKNVDAPARSYMIARKNILTDLRQRLCSKLPKLRLPCRDAGDDEDSGGAERSGEL